MSTQIIGIESELDATDYREISGLVADAIANPEIIDLLFIVNSPGGTWDASLLSLVRQIRNSPKPVNAWVLEAGSCAYFLISSCDHLACADSSWAGGIGCYVVLPPNPEMIPGSTLISTAPAKGICEVPLTGEAVEIIREELKQIADLMIAEIKISRSQVSEEATTSGKCYLGVNALGHGLVDAVDGDVDSFFARIAGPSA